MEAPVSSSAPLFFMADSHAGIRGDLDEQAKLQAFRELVDRVIAAQGSLWILGDLFDFWFEWKHVVPKRSIHWLMTLRRCIEAGCAVHMLPGNHDFRLEGFLESDLGVQVHEEPFRLDLPALRVLMHHGDGLDPTEKGYRLLRKLIRNRFSYAWFTAMHPDWGMGLADRSGSRDRNHRWKTEHIRAYLKLACQALCQPGDDLFLLGHAHRCVVERVNGVVAVVLPPFIHPSRSYLTLHQGRLSLETLRPDSLEADDPSPFPEDGLRFGPTGESVS